MKRKSHEGFTLVEMTIVLIIVSLLILVFIPNLSNQREKAADTGHAAIVKSVETQLELFKIENGRPMSEAEMESNIKTKQLEIYREYGN